MSHKFPTPNQLGAVDLTEERKDGVSLKLLSRVRRLQPGGTCVFLSRSKVRPNQSGQQVSSSRLIRAKANKDPLSCTSRRRRGLDPDLLQRTSGERTLRGSETNDAVSCQQGELQRGVRTCTSVWSARQWYSWRVRRVRC